ncbi:hypothetical protein Halha_1861 [Halobacteroides halobius DSM 5150]|uniref:Bypass of forespore C C-terminal domain-containing protein n=1 Tax=Halobacteroides halobius (strain ATCC 35273 / DSM 5150 / MD-1) TaxID=748449 RepID=L0KBM7_HALHC|nr:BofC C-terminal domain-containing protein [Halobacteroides halobius]AGB41774.1 hypothetical protein Halha_1861 [Halobacteroides halobius DSM 5150]
MKPVRAIVITVILTIIMAVITYYTLGGLGATYFGDKSKKGPKSKVKEPNHNSNQQIKDLIKQEQKKIDQQEPKLNQQLSKDKLEIDLNTELILKVANSKMKDKIVNQQKVNSSWAGLSQDELANRLTKGQIVEFNSKQVVIEINTKEAKTIKPEDIIKSKEEKDSKEEIPDKLFLSLKDGYVAVYRGDILGKHEVVEIKKDIPVDQLSQQDVKALQMGIEVEDEEELLKYLEGFASATD